MSDLTTVNNTLKDQNNLLKISIEGTATQQAKNAEVASEKKQYDEQVLSTLSAISEAIKSIQPFKIDKPDSTSFLGAILKAFGLTALGALGLAAGLTAGWMKFVGNLIIDLGKVILKLIKEIPRPKFIDDIIAAFKMDGFVGKKFKAALDLLTPKFIDDIIAAFKMEGTIGAKFKAAIDAITPKFITDMVAAFKGEGRIATKFKNAIDAITPKFITDIFKAFGSEGRIGKLFKTAIDTLKPQFIDDIFKAFGAEGRIGILFKNAVNFLKPQFIDDIVAAFKTEGTIGSKFKKAVDALTPKFIDDIIKSFGADGKVGQLFTKIKNFFVGETNIFKTIGTAVDTAMDSLKTFTGSIFTKIASPFKWLRANTATGSLIGDMIDAVMDVFKVAGGEGGFLTKIFGGIKGVFSSLKSIGATLMAPFTAIGNIFGTVTKAGTGGIMKTIMAFLNPFKSVFSTFARIGAKLAAPLNLIMGILDAGFETKDAVEKSEGFFATLLNGIIGAIGGFIDGAVIQVADLLKTGVIFVADWLGFGDEGWVKTLKDLPSFSEKWNEWLDIAYAWVNELFNVDIATVGRTLLGDTIYDWLFGDTTDAQIMAKKKEIEMHQKELKEGDTRTALGFSRKSEIEDLQKQIAKLEEEKKEKVIVVPAIEKQEGGMVGMSPFAKGSLGKALGLESGGLFTLTQGEMVLDNQAAQTFMKAAQFLSDSRMLEQARMNGVTPVTINNINNSQHNPVVSNQTTTIRTPESVRSGEPTMATAIAAYAS